MIVSRRKSQLSNTVQRALIVQFVAGTPARTAAELVGVNRHTATLFYHKLRELITLHPNQEASVFNSQGEVDESYLGRVCKGKRGRGAVGKSVAFGLRKRAEKVHTAMLTDTSSRTVVGLIQNHLLRSDRSLSTIMAELAIASVIQI